MWGQDKGKGERLRRVRIIPTRVGTSDQVKEITDALKDHPHACGDKCS